MLPFEEKISIYSNVSGCAKILENFAQNKKNVSFITRLDMMPQEGAKLFILDKSDENIKDFLTSTDIENTIVIINSDDEEITKNLIDLRLCLITCGLCTKSTVTASSIEDDSCVYCLQRIIPSFNNSTISPQEFTISHSGDSIFETLSCVTSMLISGEKKANIIKMKF